MGGSETELTELCPDKRKVPNSSETTTDQGPDEDRSKWYTVLGYVSAVVMSIMATTSTGCSQSLGGYVPRFELTFARFLCMCIFAVPVIIYKGTNLLFDKRNLVLVGILCVDSFFYTLVFFEASISVPIATLGGLEYSLILILTAVIETFVIVKRFVPKTILSVLLCLIGILLMIQPAFLFAAVVPYSTPRTTPVCVAAEYHKDNETRSSIVYSRYSTSGTNQTFSNNTSVDETMGIPTGLKGYLLIVSSGSLFVLYIYVIRYIKDVPAYVIFSWKSVVGMFISAVIMMVVERDKLMFPHSPTCVGLLIGHGICAAGADLFSMLAIVLLTPVTFSILLSFTLVFLMCAQYTVLSHVNPGHHNALEFGGTILVLLACVLEPVYELWKTWRAKYQ